VCLLQVFASSACVDTESGHREFRLRKRLVSIKFWPRPHPCKIATHVHSSPGDLPPCSPSSTTRGSSSAWASGWALACGGRRGASAPWTRVGLHDAVPDAIVLLPLQGQHLRAREGRGRRHEGEGVVVFALSALGARSAAGRHGDARGEAQGGRWRGAAHHGVPGAPVRGERACTMASTAGDQPCPCITRRPCACACRLARASPGAR
jgi:hypothetical protein